MTERRVVVTGLGLVTPLGSNVKDSWQGIKDAKTGISNITHFPIDDLPEGVSKVAGEVKYGEGEGLFNPTNFIEVKEQKKMDKFIWYAVAAADEAIKDSGLDSLSEDIKVKAGVVIGSGIGGLETIQDNARSLFEKGIRRISPFFVPASIVNMASGVVSMRHGFRGPNVATVSACASGSHAIGESARMIQRGDADIIVAGGAEAAVCQLGIGGFSAMKALSTNFNNNPTKASRPWDKERDGFVMGEGAGIIVLEEYEHARKRGAKIYAELGGYGLSGDAYHMTAPDSESRGAKLALKMTLNDAKINPEDVDYINAHGTSTPVGDPLEFNAVKELFSSCLDKISMSSTKSATGHALGAAGAMEAIFSILAIRDSILPATLNLENIDEACQGIDLVPLKVKEKKINCAISNSFGFGGTNACLLFKKI